MHSEAPSLESSEHSRWRSVSFAARVCFVGLVSLGASTSKESQERGFVGLFHRWTVSDQKLLQWELLRKWFFYYWWHSWTYPVQNSAFVFNSSVLYYLRQDFSDVCSLPFDCYVSLILFCQNSARYSSSHLESQVFRKLKQENCHEFQTSLSSRVKKGISGSIVWAWASLLWVRICVLWLQDHCLSGWPKAH